MSQQELLKQVVSTLTTLSIDYMLTGSLASSSQGEPRSTHDIDLVITLSDQDIPKLTEAFPPPDFYLSESSIREAISHGTMFNLLSMKDGEKVDFWLLTNEAFDQSRFARKKVDLISGLSLYVSTPEDTILAKLRWAKLSGGSEKQFVDALRVFEINQSSMDIAYLEQWSKDLQVEDLWLQIQEKATSADESAD